MSSTKTIIMAGEFSSTSSLGVKHRRHARIVKESRNPWWICTPDGGDFVILFTQHYLTESEALAWAARNGFTETVQVSA